MSFILVYGDSEAILRLPFESHVEDQLARLLDPPSTPSGEREKVDLASRIVDAITNVLEATVVPPSEKQIKYAVGIARELALELPADVLQDRDAMKIFLNLHAETYRRSKAR